MVIFLTLFYFTLMLACKSFNDWKLCEDINNHPLLFLVWIIFVIIEVFNFCKKVEEHSNKNKNS